MALRPETLTPLSHRVLSPTPTAGAAGAAGVSESRTATEARKIRRGTGAIRRFLIRWGIRGTLLAAIWGVAHYKFSTEVDQASWAVRSAIHSAIYDVQINFEGLNHLRPEDLEVLVPVEKPVWWWLVAGPTVQRAVLENSLVKDAVVSRCSPFAIKCFNVTVVERVPSALVSVRGEWSLVGDDGGIIGPISHEGRARSQLPVISGLERFESVPQLLSSKLLTILELIEGLTTRGVTTVAIISDNEVLVTLDVGKPELLFELGARERLREQLVRLGEVELQLGERYNQARRIDLSFTSQAVVSFPPSDQAAPKGQSRGQGQSTSVSR